MHQHLERAINQGRNDCLETWPADLTGGKLLIKNGNKQLNFAWHRCNFTSEALRGSWESGWVVSFLFLMPFFFAWGSAVKCKIWNLHSDLPRVGAKGTKRRDTRRRKAQHLTAARSSHCTCQRCWSPEAPPACLASLWPIHPHFKVDVTTPPWPPPPSPPLCCAFKQVCGSSDVTSPWQMAPHWDVGRRIYGRGWMLLLNLRRCTALPPSSVTSSIFFPSLSLSPLPFSFCCFIPFPCLLLSPVHSCPTASLCPSSYSLLLPFPSFAHAPVPPLLITPPYSRPSSRIVSRRIKRMDKITQTVQRMKKQTKKNPKKNDFTFLTLCVHFVPTTCTALHQDIPTSVFTPTKSRTVLLTTVCKYRVERYYC